MRLRQFLGQLVAAHVHGYDRGRGHGRVRIDRLEQRPDERAGKSREIRDRGHDPRDRDEDIAYGVKSGVELLAEWTFAVDDRGDGADHRADHDDVDDECADMSHAAAPC